MGKPKIIYSGRITQSKLLSMALVKTLEPEVEILTLEDIKDVKGGNVKHILENLEEIQISELTGKDRGEIIYIPPYDNWELTYFTLYDPQRIWEEFHEEILSKLLKKRLLHDVVCGVLDGFETIIKEVSNSSIKEAATKFALLDFFSTNWDESLEDERSNLEIALNLTVTVISRIIQNIVSEVDGKRKVVSNLHFYHENLKTGGLFGILPLPHSKLDWKKEVIQYNNDNPDGHIYAVYYPINSKMWGVEVVPSACESLFPNEIEISKEETMAIFTSKRYSIFSSKEELVSEVKALIAKHKRENAFV